MPGLGGMDPRQMAMMMRKMGIEVRELDDVVEVVVRTRSKDYRFSKAAVSVMKAQGQETWQVQGKPEVVVHQPAAVRGGVAGQEVPDQEVPDQEVPDAADALEVTEEDVRLVMEQSGCDAATARKTLEEVGGDLAEAIVRLGR